MTAQSEPTAGDPVVDYHVIQVGPSEFIAIVVDTETGQPTDAVDGGVLWFQAADDPAEKLRRHAEGDGITIRDLIVHCEERRA